MARPSNRERLLDAYEELLTTRGAGDATLDAIAELAGVSKGGLTYHFPSKADLLAGFSDRLLARIDDSLSEAPTEPAAVIRWYLDYELTDPSERALWQSLMAALHGADEGLRTTVREAFARYARPLDVLDVRLAEHVRLVGDGLFLNALVGTPRPSADLVEHLVAELSSQIDSAR